MKTIELTDDELQETKECIEFFLADLVDNEYDLVHVANVRKRLNRILVKLSLADIQTIDTNTQIE